MVSNGGNEAAGMGWMAHGGLIAWMTMLFEVQTVMLLRVREAVKTVNWL